MQGNKKRLLRASVKFDFFFFFRTFDASSAQSETDGESRLSHWAQELRDLAACFIFDFFALNLRDKTAKSVERKKKKASSG